MFPQPQTCNSRNSERSKYLTVRHVMEIVFHVMCLTCQLQNMTAVSLCYCVPISVAARSKAWNCSHLACGDLRVRIPPGRMDVFRVCCQVEVSATGLSLDQRCPIECSPSVISKPQRLGGPGPLRLSSHGKIYILLLKACYIVWITLIASYSLFTNILINNCMDEGENTEQECVTWET